MPIASKGLWASSHSAALPRVSSGVVVSMVKISPTFVGLPSAIATLQTQKLFSSNGRLRKGLLWLSQEVRDQTYLTLVPPSSTPAYRTMMGKKKRTQTTKNKREKEIEIKSFLQIMPTLVYVVLVKTPQHKVANPRLFLHCVCVCFSWTVPNMGRGESLSQHFGAGDDLSVRDTCAEWPGQQKELGQPKHARMHSKFWVRHLYSYYWKFNILIMT